MGWTIIFYLPTFVGVGKLIFETNSMVTFMIPAIVVASVAVIFIGLTNKKKQYYNFGRLILSCINGFLVATYYFQTIYKICHGGTDNVPKLYNLWHYWLTAIVVVICASIFCLLQFTKSPKLITSGISLEGFLCGALLGDQVVRRFGDLDFRFELPIKLVCAVIFALGSIFLSNQILENPKYYDKWETNELSRRKFTFSGEMNNNRIVSIIDLKNNGPLSARLCILSLHGQIAVSFAFFSMYFLKLFAIDSKLICSF